MNLNGIELTRIGLGTNRLVNTPQNRQFVNDAVGAGINLIDTAHLYADGESERTLGEALGEAELERCVIATKGGFHGGDDQTISAEIEESLRRLRTDTIGLYYLHRVDPDVEIERSLSTIKRYQDEGKIASIGLSNADVEQLERARGVVEVVAVQNRYNLAHRESDDVIDYCEEHGIAFVPYKPLRERVAARAEIAATHGATESQITLAWLLRRSPVMVPIPGTLSIEHVRENLAALEIELSDEEFEAIQ